MKGMEAEQERKSVHEEIAAGTAYTARMIEILRVQAWRDQANAALRQDQREGIVSHGEAFMRRRQINLEFQDRLRALDAPGETTENGGGGEA